MAFLHEFYACSFLHLDSEYFEERGCVSGIRNVLWYLAQCSSLSWYRRSLFDEWQNEHTTSRKSNSHSGCRYPCLGDHFPTPNSPDDAYGDSLASSDVLVCSCAVTPWEQRYISLMRPPAACTSRPVLILLGWCGNILCGRLFFFFRFSSVQSFSHAWLFVTPRTAARQASLSITNSQSLLKLMSTESVISFNNLILCHPLLLLPSIFPSIRVFSSQSGLLIRWTKYWSFSFSVSPFFN